MWKQNFASACLRFFVWNWSFTTFVRICTKIINSAWDFRPMVAIFVSSESRISQIDTFVFVTYSDCTWICHIFMSYRHSRMQSIMKRIALKIYNIMHRIQHSCFRLAIERVEERARKMGGGGSLVISQWRQLLVPDPAYIKKNRMLYFKTVRSISFWWLA